LLRLSAFTMLVVFFERGKKQYCIHVFLTNHALTIV